MICKSDFVSFSGCIHHVLIVEVEEEAAHVLVVHLAPPVRLVLGDDLAAVLGDELVLVGKVLDEDPPAGHVGGRHVELLAEAALDHDVLAGDLGDVVLVGAAAGAEVWIALPHRQEAGALLGGALRPAPAPGEPVLTVEIQTKVREVFTITDMVSRREIRTPAQRS